jgi:ankyrin repeat protein
MGASTSVQQSNPLLPAGLEKDDFVALSSNYDINAISQPSGAKFSISVVGEVGIALAQSLLAEKFNRVSYDKRKFFLGEDNIPYSRQVLYAWQCPKGHSLVPIVACPSVSFLPSQCTGLSAPQVEKEPLVMMPQTSDVPQTSHTDSDPLQLTSNKKTGNYAMQNSRIQSDSLRSACADGNLDLVSKLLDQGVDVNNQNVMGITPLHACAFASNIKIAQLLISHGADQTQGDLSEMAPIHYAAAEGALELVRYFVECAGTSIAGIVGAEGITPAHMAANIGHDEVLQYISEECGPEYCNQLDDQGNSPLHIASSRGHAKCVDVLLQIGCSANLRNSNDLTPLMAALRANDADRTLDAARLLLPFTQVLETDGVVIPPKLSGNGILHSLSPFSDGFPKDVLEIERTTKLHAAVMCGSIFELRELLFAGAKVDYFDAEGFTPFHLACSKNRLDMAALMLNFGIIAELATSLLLPGTDSPLICSIVANSFPLVQYLVRKFPSWLEVRDSKGVLPVAVALDNRCSLALVRALVVVGGANLKAIAKSHNGVFRNHENVASEVQPKSVYAYASNFRTEAAQFVEIMGVQPIAAKFCWCDELAKYVDVWSGDQCPLVHQAAFFGRLPALLELLKCGRPLSDDQDAAGFTALHAACASGSLEIVNLLLNANCIVDTSDNQGHFSPLFFSVNGGFPVLVERLLPLVLDASTLYDSQDRSLLSFLPSDESAAIAISSIILSLFPFIDGFVENPRVAAHIEHVRSTAQSSASSICNSDTLSLTNLLAELPLLIHCRMNDEGHTLLHLACERLEASVCVELLCSVGAPVEAVMSNGLSALHVAALYKNLAAMTVLLSYGASADLPDQNGFTPLHIVAIESYSDGIDLLLTEWHAESMSTPFRIDSRYESLSRPSSADASTFNGCTDNTDRIADEIYCHICLLSASHSDTFDWFTCSVQNCCNGYSICVTCIDALIEKERSTSPYAEIRSSSPNLAMQSVESSKLGILFDKKVSIIRENSYELTNNTGGPIEFSASV